jgi:hypothetical protein
MRIIFSIIRRCKSAGPKFRRSRSHSPMRMVARYWSESPIRATSRIPRSGGKVRGRSNNSTLPCKPSTPDDEPFFPFSETVLHASTGRRFSARRVLAVASIDRSRCVRSALQTMRPTGNTDDNRMLWLCRRPDHLRVSYCRFHFGFTPESGLNLDIAPCRFCARRGYPNI